MRGFAQDLRYGLRMLRSTPVVTAAALVALALGIGANTAIWSVLDAVVLHPLPFPELDRLVMVQQTNAARGLDHEQLSPPNFADLRDENRVFESVGAFSWWDANLTGVEEPERLQGFLVSPGFFAALGVAPALGRTFLAEEEAPGRDAVVVLSHRLWQRRFASDPRVLGTTLTLNGIPHVAIGVMGASFDYPPGKPELWVPLTLDRAQGRGGHSLKVVARLRPGMGRERTREDLDRIAAGLAARFPDANAGWGLASAPLLDDVVRYSRPALFGLLGAVGFVLLIACANVANLLLARATARHREIAVRTALGASRARLFRQLMTESVILSLAGGTLGILVALWGIESIRAAIPAELVRFIPGWEASRLDGSMLLFTLALSFGTGILFGIAPALAASRPDPGETLKETGRSMAGGSRTRLRGALVVTELALAMVLLCGAALSVRGFRTLVGENLALRTDHVLAAEVTLPEAGYGERARIASFYRQALERIATLPGVETAAVVSSLPMSGSWQDRTFSIEGRPETSPSERPRANLCIASSDYFRALGIPVSDGRGIGEGDDERSEPVAVVSEKLARRFFPGESPLGRKLKLGGPDSKSAWRTIVGVVADVRRFGLELEGAPTFYLPYPQQPQLGMTLVARTSLDPRSLAGPLRSEMHALDPDQPLYNVRTMERVIADAVAGPRLTMGLMGVLAVLALLLAAVGVYAVMAYATSERTHEIGVRMALGAARGDVLRMVLRQGARLLAIGLGVGLLGAVGTAKALAGAMFWVGPERASTFGVVALLLAAIALLATLPPALRATRIDPIEALRHE